MYKRLYKVIVRDERMSQYYDTNTSKGSAVPDHDVIMRGRRLLDITGVKQVESFDNEEFLLETVMGFLAIKGQNLQMKNLDVDKGIVSIKGKVFELVYLDDQHGEKAKGFFSKLFR
jgi:sporulation protein YabP